MHARLKVKHFPETLRNSHFVQIKKVVRRGCPWERGSGLLGGGGVMDIPQDEVGHCSLSLVKRAL